MDDVKKADWLVRLDGAPAQVTVQLVPAAGWQQGPGRKDPPALAPTERTSNRYKNVKLALETIARATNFVRLATQPRGALTAQFGQDAQNQRQSPLRGAGSEGPGSEQTAKPLQWQHNGQAIAVGTAITLQIENKERYAVDVTAFYVDGRYGITAIYPPPGGNESNRLAAGEQVHVAGTVEDKTLGQEHFVVLAVRSQPQEEAVDLSPLGQPPLEAVVARGKPRAEQKPRQAVAPGKAVLHGGRRAGPHPPFQSRAGQLRHPRGVVPGCAREVRDRREGQDN